jgi:hypothetical protein
MFWSHVCVSSFLRVFSCLSVLAFRNIENNKGNVLILIWKYPSFLTKGWAGQRSRYNDSLRAGWSCDRIPVGRDLPHLSISALGLTQPPVKRVPGLSWGLRRQSREVDHPPLSSTEVLCPSGPVRVCYGFLYLYLAKSVNTILIEVSHKTNLKVCRFGLIESLHIKTNILLYILGTFRELVFVNIFHRGLFIDTVSDSSYIQRRMEGQLLKNEWEEDVTDDVVVP